MIKNFLFPKLKCSSSRYFYQVLWQFLSSGFRFGIFGQTPAAAGGEMRPNYFKNRPLDRKLQARQLPIPCAFLKCGVCLKKSEPILRRTLKTNEDSAGRNI